MTVVTVLPRDDGHSFPQSWMVHVDGDMKSPHTTKEAAKNRAREYASDGDILEVRRVDGTIQKRVTVKKSARDRDADDGSFPGLTGTPPSGSTSVAFPDDL